MKKRILFVDDERNVLDGLRRALRTYRDVWHMEFVQSGDRALARLDEAPFDVIVSDIQMPGMDGIELLGEVCRRHPRVARIVLSAQTKREKIVETILAPVHQYLSKPCDPTRLKDAVVRLCGMQEKLGHAPLRETVSRINRLPSLPTVYAELVEVLQSEDVSLDRVGELISKDVAMTAKLLQLYNATFFDLGRRVESVSQAAALLGVKLIRSFVETGQVFTPFDGSRSSGFSLQGFTDRSLAVAACAQRIAAAHKPDDKQLHEDSFLAGLVHDIGQLVLADNLGERYGEAWSLAGSQRIPLQQAELQALGASHAEVGAYLLGLWGLPPQIVEAAACHHQPRRASGSSFAPLTAVHVADVLVRETRTDGGLQGRPELDLDYVERVGVADQLPGWREMAAAGEGDQQRASCETVV